MSCNRVECGESAVHRNPPAARDRHVHINLRVGSFYM